MAKYHQVEESTCVGDALTWYWITLTVELYASDLVHNLISSLRFPRMFRLDSDAIFRLCRGPVGFHRRDILASH